MQHRLLLTVIFSFSYLFLLAQKSFELNLNWEQATEFSITEFEQVNVIACAECDVKPENGFRPVYSTSVLLNDNPTTIIVSLSNVVTESVSRGELAVATGMGITNADFEVTATVGQSRGEAYAQISLIPIRKGAFGGFEKLLSATVSITSQYQHRSSTRALSFAPSSKLASGEWYKLGVLSTGVYKLNYTTLQTMGLDMSALSFASLNIYGNGQGMLPEDNSVNRADDLILNATEVVDNNGNGFFDTDDYVLFYGVGPHIWKNEGTRFSYQTHLYSDTAFYFVGIGTDAAQRVTTEAQVGGGTDVTQFSEHMHHELDQVNLIKTGSQWYGEKFDILTNYVVPFSVPGIDQTAATSEVVVTTVSRATGALNETFTININSGLATTSHNIASVSGYTYAATGSSTLTFQPNSSAINVSISYSKNQASSYGHLNYVTLNTRRNLTMSGDQLMFRDLNSVGVGNVSNFILANAINVQAIWDVTDPTQPRIVDHTLVGSTRHFSLQTDTLREFIAFTGNNVPTPIPVGPVANQDLHSMTVVDYFIVSHPDFLAQANELATFHNTCDGLSVAVVTPHQIYNEFSCGAQDITAIRMFMKMFYDRAAGDPNLMPKYLLLMGDASYDPKDRLSGNTNFIPTYQSPNSVSHISSFLSDDYFGLLDDSEAMNNTDPVDIGIGRMPVQSAVEAQNMVDKIRHYVACEGPTSIDACTALAGSTVFGDWRTKLSFVGDDEDSNIHMGDSDIMVDSVRANAPEMNVNKIYFDAYVQESTPGGERYPEVNEAITKAVESGVLILNYIGHGGEVGWAHERVLDVPTINSWDNFDNMPLFMTATCEFSRFDDPGRTSAGELVFLNDHGGSIALLTTTRLVFSGDNRELGKVFWGTVFDEPNNEPMRLGDVVRLTKVGSTSSSQNHRSFSLIGDPALQIAIPKHDVITTTINGNPVPGVGDTLRALGTVTITGEVHDVFGAKLTSYNGVVFPTVYDKSVNITTLQNDGLAPFNFDLQKNVIYKGKATVTNGDFSFTFVVPKDIVYTYGPGRISYYVVDETGADGHGYSEDFTVGGTDTSATLDTDGPEIDLYMNDENFVFGGITNEEPILLAKVFDSNGINTVGSGIGHDITAILDENTSNAVILNDYYESDLDTYTSGSVTYPFSKLEEGTHTLTFKIWDVHNNSNEATTEFVVAESAELALDHVLNYPNPFTTYTEFWFEHNQPCEDLEVSIQVFTVAGNLVKTINNRVTCSGFRVDPIVWDGRDDYGDQLARGTYIYRVGVTAPDGEKAEKFEKLVILK